MTETKRNFDSVKLVKEFLFPTLAFVISFGLLILIFTRNGFSLFDHNGSTLISLDMQSQYIAMVRYFKDLLENGKSFTYTLSKLFGGNFLSIFTYYLASPFNLLIVFFEYQDIPLFFVWTLIIKMSISSLGMYLMFRFSSHKLKFSYLGFCISYSLISYSFVYASNFMFIDGVMILPFVVLGINYLMKQKQPWIYFISIAYALLSSWYIGAFICIFSVLYFAYAFFADERKIREKVPVIVWFFVFSLIGGLIASPYWISAFMHFSGTKAGSSYVTNLNFSLSISTFIDGLLENGYVSHSQIQVNTGYMTMFTGVISLFFFVMFFFNRKYSIREKISAGALSLLFVLIPTIVILNLAFHGGREPAWFPTRYSFLIGFIVCYFAGKEILEFEDTPWYAPLGSLGTGAIALIIASFVSNDSKIKEAKLYKISWPSFIIFCSIGILSLLVILLKNKGKTINRILNISFSVIVVGLSTYSSFRGGDNIVEKNAASHQYQKYSTYLLDDSYSSDFNKIKSLEEVENYRMEAVFNRPGNYNECNNNPLFYSYSGLNHFSSNELKSVQEYMLKLGMHYNGYSESFDGGSTSAVSSLFGVKYIMDNTDVSHRALYMYNAPFTKLDGIVSDKPSIGFYKNDYALPLGFVMDSHDSTYVGEGVRLPSGLVRWHDHFEYQNAIYEHITSDLKEEIDGELNSKKIFKKIDVERYHVDSGITYVENEVGEIRYTSTNSGYVNFRFTVPSEAYGKSLYFCNKSLDGGVRYYVDGQYQEINTYWHKGIKSIEDTLSHTHTLNVYFDQNQSNKLIRPEVYYEDNEILMEYLTKIKLGGANNLKPINKFNEAGFEGTFNLAGTNKTFVFTLPNEKGIEIYLDGKKQNVITRLNVMSAISLNDVSEGQHTIKIIYKDYGLIFGLVACGFGISLIPAMFFLPILDKKYLLHIKNKEN